MRYQEICESDSVFNPIKPGEYTSSFVFVNGGFVGVPYQGHRDIIAKMAGLERPDKNDYDRERDFFDATDRYTAQNNIVQGVFQAGQPRLKSWMTLKGSKAAIKAAYLAFIKTYPKLAAELDNVTYDVLNAEGKHTEFQDLEGDQIDRKLGRR